MPGNQQRSRDSFSVNDPPAGGALLGSERVSESIRGWAQEAEAYTMCTLAGRGITIRGGGNALMDLEVLSSGKQRERGFANIQMEEGAFSIICKSE